MSFLSTHSYVSRLITHTQNRMEYGNCEDSTCCHSKIFKLQRAWCLLYPSNYPQVSCLYTHVCDYSQLCRRSLVFIVTNILPWKTFMFFHGLVLCYFKKTIWIFSPKYVAMMYTSENLEFTWDLMSS